MPLIKSKSKKAFEHNVKAEMDAHPGKESRAQNLAIAYSVKRKASKKKMAEGGEVNEDAATEHRPMPEEHDRDAAEIKHNEGKKALRDSDWTDNPTVKQAQKMSITKMSSPKMVEGNLKVKLRGQEEDLMAMHPASPKEEPERQYDEEEPNRQGISPHKMKMMAKGGMINEEVSMHDAEEDNEEHPAHLEEDDDQMTMPVDEYMASHFAHGGMAMEEEELEHAADIAAAIMARRKSREVMDSGSADEDYAERMAEGGEVDIEENEEEQPNGYYDRNEHAALKENYDQELHNVHEPEDSNEHADMREEDEENDDDESIVDAIMRKMKKRSPITR